MPIERYISQGVIVVDPTRQERREYRDISKKQRKIEQILGDTSEVVNPRLLDRVIEAHPEHAYTADVTNDRGIIIAEVRYSHDNVVKEQQLRLELTRTQSDIISLWLYTKILSGDNAGDYSNQRMSRRDGSICMPSRWVASLLTTDQLKRNIETRLGIRI